MDGLETRLVGDPVGRVWDDHMDGVLFRSAEWGTYWLKAGESNPIRLQDLDPDNPWLDQVEHAFTGLLDGRPMVFYAGIAGPVDDHYPCGDWQLVGRDLQAGTEVGLMCLPIEDAWFGIRSVGGGLFVGELGIASGSCGSSRDLHFWDADGQDVSLAQNPFPVSCEPCELSAIISPGGGLLAYRFRGDSKWPPQEWDHLPWEEWWERSKAIPADFVVLDLDTGDERWRIETPAWIELADFDGRHLVTVGPLGDGETASTIYDTWGENSPMTVPGLVTLVRTADT